MELFQQLFRDEDLNVQRTSVSDVLSCCHSVVCVIIYSSAGTICKSCLRFRTDDTAWCQQHGVKEKKNRTLDEMDFLVLERWEYDVNIQKCGSKTSHNKEQGNETPCCAV